MESNPLIGMLYLVTVVLTRIHQNEKITKKMIIIGNDRAEIGQKLKWFFDPNKYDSIHIKAITKIRDKIHVLSTAISELEKTTPAPNEKQGSEFRNSCETPPVDAKLYAVGIATTMVADDEGHALRKVGKALINRSFSESASGPKFNEQTIIQVEQTSFSDGFAKARDTSMEKLRAHFVRG